MIVFLRLQWMSGPHAHIALGKRGHEASTMGNAATGNCDTEKRRCLDVSESTGPAPCHPVPTATVFYSG